MARDEKQNGETEMREGRRQTEKEAAEKRMGRGETQVGTRPTWEEEGKKEKKKGAAEAREEMRQTGKEKVERGRRKESDRPRPPHQAPALSVVEKNPRLWSTLVVTITTIRPVHFARTQVGHPKRRKGGVWSVRTVGTAGETALPETGAVHRVVR
jgi:hypothetical protein